MQTLQENTFLKFIDFSKLSLWDIKRLFLSSVKSNYDIVSLKEVIKHRSEKIAIYEEPEKEFWILWVNNKVWIFDSYKEFWKNINQKYKKMYEWDLAYNPYRVNIGSVWVKTKENKFEYISPAYVVFSCDKERLTPEFFFILFKTNLFNEIINQNTTGSVRQNLKFSTLAEIKIPLPSLSEQNRIVENYKKNFEKAENAEKRVEKLEKEIESYLMEELGIEIEEKEEKKNNILNFIKSENIDKWWVKYLLNSLDLGKILKSKIYWMNRLKNIIEINPRTSFNKEKDISFIPMKYISDKEWKVINKDIIKWINSNWYTKFIEWDLIWSRITPCMQNWKSAIVKNLKNWIWCGSTEYHVLRNTNNLVNLDFIYIILRLNIILQFATNYFTWTAWQQRVPKEFLEELQIPLPPLKIQEKIVEHIWNLKEEIKELKKLSVELKGRAKVEFEGEIFS